MVFKYHIKIIWIHLTWDLRAHFRIQSLEIQQTNSVTEAHKIAKEIEKKTNLTNIHT